MTAEKKAYIEATTGYCQHLYDTVVVPFMKKHKLSKIESIMGIEIYYDDRGKEMEDHYDDLPGELQSLLYREVEGTPLEDSFYMSWVVNSQL